MIRCCSWQALGDEELDHTKLFSCSARCNLKDDGGGGDGDELSYKSPFGEQRHGDDDDDAGLLGAEFAHDQVLDTSKYNHALIQTRVQKGNLDSDPLECLTVLRYSQEAEVGRGVYSMSEGDDLLTGRVAAGVRSRSDLVSSSVADGGELVQVLTKEQVEAGRGADGKLRVILSDREPSKDRDNSVEWVSLGPTISCFVCGKWGLAKIASGLSSCSPDFESVGFML